MNKLILALGICFAFFALAEASRPVCRPVCTPGRDRIIACVRDSSGKNCRKLEECRMREENCRLLQQGKPVLIEANKSQCRNILTPTGSGKCVRRICPTSPCQDDGKILCWRSDRGQCQLLTRCQREVINCKRELRDALNQTDPRECKGMRIGQSPQKCRRG